LASKIEEKLSASNGDAPAAMRSYPTVVSGRFMVVKGASEIYYALLLKKPLIFHITVQ
jgi:hypothetical protein